MNKPTRTIASRIDDLQNEITFLLADMHDEREDVKELVMQSYDCLELAASARHKPATLRWWDKVLNRMKSQF